MTDWDLFFNDSGFNPLTDVITSYISFCEDTVTPAKQITIHPNNNPWVTKNMKMCLGIWLLEGDTHRARELEKFRRKAKMAKINYKDKVEHKLTSGNAREAWQGLNIMMGRAPNLQGSTAQTLPLLQSNLTTSSAGTTTAVYQQAGPSQTPVHPTRLSS